VDVRQQVGRHGEDAAVAYLEQHGFVVVARNWRCRTGELDVVAREGGTLVFCEVKTRRGLGFGPPLDAITWRKQSRLRQLASAYLAATGGHRGLIRIDAIGILLRPGAAPEIHHVRGAA
jgi:putative endonuclease